MTAHVGKLIEAVVKEKRLTTAEIKVALGINGRSPSYTYKKKSMSVEELWRISESLDHDFFADLKPVVTNERLHDAKFIERLFRTEKIKRINAAICFPQSLVKDLGLFLKQIGDVGLKMGFKVGDIDPTM
ncbi:hypothetical protein [Hufsiella ginkgonis]|uniref:Uncharacterized protein n=1 Tax=Hufsiella ginkgonis TaxID=2695274 RepID=A0A7K1XTN4_9SPHI|nr:hypothetical protein [Hufsiella ginkgonis]MXV14334.1 hypothetical protein [Hufsiella ginkgonis]